MSVPTSCKAALRECLFLTAADSNGLMVVLGYSSTADNLLPSRSSKTITQYMWHEHFITWQDCQGQHMHWHQKSPWELLCCTFINIYMSATDH